MKWKKTQFGCRSGRATWQWQINSVCALDTKSGRATDCQRALLNSRGVARNSFWVGIIFYCTIIQSYTSSLTTSAAIIAKNNFQGLILGGYIYRYTPRRYASAQQAPPPMQVTLFMADGVRNSGLYVASYSRVYKYTSALRGRVHYGVARICDRGRPALLSWA